MPRAPKSVVPAPAPKPRLLILTDIGGDPDDQQSLVRLLVFNNEFKIEGLVASASGTPGELQDNVVRPELIVEQIDAYAQVYPSLRAHDPSFASPEALRSVVKRGNPQRGRANVGEGQDTEGSNWIISQVDANDSELLNIAVWGGPTELAQALYRVKKSRSEAELQRFVSRLRVHAIGHQDDSGMWIVEEFPDLFYVLNVVQEVPRTVDGPKIDRRGSVYRGIYLGGDESLTSGAWLAEHVVENHGALGALYPTKTWAAPNPHSAMKEGDTPSWFYFLPNGLSDPEHPAWGNWGGRFQAKQGHPTGRLFRDAEDTFDGNKEARATVYRWRPTFQNAFAARMDWCVFLPAQANHEPRAVIGSDASRAPVVHSVKAAEMLNLDASASTDPDGNTISFSWWTYPEADSYKGSALPQKQTGPKVTIQAPFDGAGTDVHVILEVSDNGLPELTAYRRVILQVQR